MLTVSTYQRTRLASDMRARFIIAMCGHARDFQPLLTRTLLPAELHAAIEALVMQGEGHGFTTRGELQLHVELGLLYGSHFPTDPQLPWVLDAFDPQADLPPNVKAEALHEGADHYLEAVYGADGRHLRQVQARSAEMVNRIHADGFDFATPDEDRLEDALLAALERLHPQRAAYVGEAAYRVLIAHARDRAAFWGMAHARAVCILATLMSIFGHGCDADPLYPWISRSLTHRNLRDGHHRARHLETRAGAWLRVVMARMPGTAIA